MNKHLTLLLFIGLAWGQGGGYALDFDGSNDYVSVNDNSSLTSTTAITISAWFKEFRLRLDEPNWERDFRFR